jgi:hypothetical protein
MRVEPVHVVKNPAVNRRSNSSRNFRFIDGQSPLIFRPAGEETTMIEFFAWLVLICVVPFVFAMLELQFKESKRSRKANQGGVTRIGGPSLIIGVTAQQRGDELSRVVHATALTARWSDRCSFWARSAAASIPNELVLHEIGLRSAPIGRKARRVVTLKSYGGQHQERLRRSEWTSLN